jgi:UDP-N-acetylglucosamine 2-epimerase (non-hydrolysing)
MGDNASAKKILLVAGARPNFMKIAPLIRAIQAHNKAATSADGKTLDSRFRGDDRDDEPSVAPAPYSVTPAKAGVQIPDDKPDVADKSSRPWIPASAGMTENAMDSRFRGNDILRPFDEIRAGLARDDKEASAIQPILVHTGQHYDYEMSKVFFEDFEIPAPDFFLNAGSASHAEQTAKVMVEFEKVCLQERPDAIVVVGDVNSTLACSVTAKKLGIRVAHVEAGLRSGDMAMPEEVNRIVTDSIADWLFVTEKDGLENLHREGKRAEQVFFVGNIMIDTLHFGLGKIEGRAPKTDLKKPCGAVTLHRPSNVDDRDRLRDILEVLREVAKDMILYFPVHPRTEKNIRQFGLQDLLGSSGIVVLPPLSYLDFLSIWKHASLVLTDSGGLQEETTALGIPCFTIRENTERPITIDEGTNLLVGTSNGSILAAYREFRGGKRKAG